MVGNALLIIFILYLLYLTMYSPVHFLFRLLKADQPINNFIVRGIFTLFFLSLMEFTGIAGILIGMLSFFQTGITKAKRIILTIICFLPLLFTIAWTLVKPEPENHSLYIIKLGFRYCAGCWLINGCTILFGKHIGALAITLISKHIQPPKPNY